MFFFLFSIGVIFIIVGIQIEKEQISQEEENSFFGIYNNNKYIIEEVSRIKERIDIIELLLHNLNVLKKDQDEITSKEFRNINLPLKYMDLLKNFTKEELKGQSLEEIASKFDLDKGEILLLKNLLKSYQINGMER